MLNDKVITHENTIKKLQKKDHLRQKNPIAESLAGPGKDYKKNARYLVEVLEKRVEELELELLRVQKQNTNKNSDDELDIIEDDEPGERVSTLPDIRITKNKQGTKSSLQLKGTLLDIKVKDEDIFKLKEEIKNSQMKVRIKDKEIFRIKTKIKQHSQTMHTAYR